MMRISINQDRTPKRPDSSAIRGEFFNRIDPKPPPASGSFGAVNFSARLINVYSCRHTMAPANVAGPCITVNTISSLSPVRPETGVNPGPTVGSGYRFEKHPREK